MPAAVRLQAVSENTSGYEFTVVVSGLNQAPQSMPYINKVMVYEGANEIVTASETINTQAALPPGPPSMTPANYTDTSIELAISTDSPNEKLSVLYAPVGSEDFQVMGGLMTGNLTVPDLQPGMSYVFMAFSQTSGGASPVVIVTAQTTGTAIVPPTPPVPTPTPTP